MYELLTTRELTVLQSMLFEGAEDAYGMARLKDEDPDWAGHYCPLHEEIASVFIAAGTELMTRLSRQPKPPVRCRAMDLPEDFGMIRKPAFGVEPCCIRESSLDLDMLAQSESVFALANLPHRNARQPGRG